MNLPTVRKSNPITGDLITRQAVNLRATRIREAFRDIGIDRPVPFVAWQHQLNDGEVDRLQKLMCGDGTKADVPLLDMADITLKQMSRNQLKRA